jgi:hypothetical protein
VNFFKKVNQSGVAPVLGVPRCSLWASFHAQILCNRFGRRENELFLLLRGCPFFLMIILNHFKRQQHKHHDESTAF